MVIKNEGKETPEGLKEKNKNRGDIHIQLEEEEDEKFKRNFEFNQTTNPANLYMVMNISLSESLCGFKKIFEHLDGRKILIEEMELIKDNQIKVIIGEGMPYKNETYRKGDLLINYKIEYPKNITYEQKKEIYKILEKKTLNEEDLDVEIDPTNTINIEEYHPNNNYYSNNAEASEHVHNQPEDCCVM